MEDEARELNIGFVARMTRGRPWMRVKSRRGLDGVPRSLAAGASGSLENRRGGTGIAGVRAPAGSHRLRHGEGRRPAAQRARVEYAQQSRSRIVVDLEIRDIPFRARLAGGKTLVVGAVSDAKKIASLKEAGAEVVIIPNDAGRSSCSS